jgi:hypothetical protein
MLSKSILETVAISGNRLRHNNNKDFPLSHIEEEVHLLTTVDDTIEDVVSNDQI